MNCNCPVQPCYSHQFRVNPEMKLIIKDRLGDSDFPEKDGSFPLGIRVEKNYCIIEVYNGGDFGNTELVLTHTELLRLIFVLSEKEYELR